MDRIYLTEKEKFRRASTYWKSVAETEGHTSQSMVVESVDDMIEAGHHTVRVHYLDKDDTASISIDGEGGITLRPMEIYSTLFTEGIDSKKKIGYHSGKGLSHSVCSQINDREDGIMFFGVKNTEDGKRIGVTWDGKSDDGLSRVFYTEGLPNDFNSDCRVAISRSKASEDDIPDLKKYLQMRYAPALNSGRLKSLTVNGEEIIAPDILFKEFINKHPQYSKDYYEAEVEVTGCCRKKHKARVVAFSTYNMRNDPDFKDYIPYCFRDDNGGIKTEIGIGFGDEYYVHVAPSYPLLKTIENKRDFMDVYIVAFVFFPSEYYRENAKGTGNKMLGIPDIEKKKSLVPVFEWIRKTSKVLNDANEQKGVSIVKEEKVVFEVDQLPEIKSVFKSEFGDNITFEKGNTILNVPESVLDEAANSGNDINLYLSGLSVNAFCKKYNHIWERVINEIAKKSMKNAKIVKNALDIVNSQMIGKKAV